MWNEETLDYDLIIVGAGPAGSSFARELAKRNPNYRILLIDGSDKRRIKPCGALLSPDAQKALAQFHLVLPKEILADPQIFTVETIDLVQKCSRHYQRFYLNMDRAKFDAWLLSMVPDSVQVVNGQCLAIAQVKQGIEVTVSRGGKKTLYRAKFLIGADGAKSMVRKKFFPNKKLKQYVSIQEWYPREQISQPVFHCIFDQESSDSCSWFMHKDEYVIFGGAFAKENCKDAFRHQKSKLEKYMGRRFPNVVKSEACLVNSPRKYSDFLLNKGNVFLLREAAGFISSSSFEGFSNAFLSAAALAEAFWLGGSTYKIASIYRQKTRKLRLKLWIKTMKRSIICNPFLRKWILKTGVGSVKLFTGSEDFGHYQSNAMKNQYGANYQ